MDTEEEIITLLLQIDSFLKSINFYEIELSKIIINTPNKRKLDFNNLSLSKGVRIIKNKDIISIHIEN